MKSLLVFALLAALIPLPARAKALLCQGSEIGNVIVASNNGHDFLVSRESIIKRYTQLLQMEVGTSAQRNEISVRFLDSAPSSPAARAKFLLAKGCEFAASDACRGSSLPGSCAISAQSECGNLAKIVACNIRSEASAGGGLAIADDRRAPNQVCFRNSQCQSNSCAGATFSTPGYCE